MSVPHNPEAQQEQGQNPEALQAERLSAQLAYETLYAAENRLIPTIDQLKVAQEWVSGVHSFDQQGNALDDKGNLLMDAGSYAFVRGYFSDRNWLLGEHEQDALARFIHKPRHAKDFELDTEHLPPVFAREVEAKLGPSSTPEEKHARAERVARLREDSKQLLTLHKDVVAKATTERTEALKRQLEADAAHILQREYDYRLPHYVSQVRTQHADFDQLDPVKQAELMQQASARAEADAILIKESHVHRQMQRAGDQTPTAVATLLENVDTSSGKRVKQLEDALEGLRTRGLDNITTIKELDRALYVKPGRQSGDRTAALLDFLPPELRQIAKLSDPVEVLAKQSRLQLRSSRNKAADRVLGEEITFRNAQLERTLEALKNYRDSLRRDLAFYTEGHSFEQFATIKDKVLDALENTEPTPKLSPESLAAFLASSEYAPRALELTLQQGRTDNYLLERELNISTPRREKLVADMVAAGLLSPERRGGGIRHIMVASIDAFLPEPTTVTTVTEGERKQAISDLFNEAERITRMRVNADKTGRTMHAKYDEARAFAWRQVFDTYPDEAEELRKGFVELINEQATAAQKAAREAKRSANPERPEVDANIGLGLSEEALGEIDKSLTQAIREYAHAAKDERGMKRGEKLPREVFVEVRDYAIDTFLQATVVELGLADKENRADVEAKAKQLRETLSRLHKKAGEIYTKAKTKKQPSSKTSAPIPRDAVEANAWKTAIEA